MSAQGTEADWYRHILYGLAGETFEAQEALDKFEAAVRCRALREAAEKIRAHWYPGFRGKSEYTQGVDDGYDKAADLIDPDIP